MRSRDFLVVIVACLGVSPDCAGDDGVAPALGTVLVERQEVVDEMGLVVPLDSAAWLSLPPTDDRKHITMRLVAGLTIFPRPAGIGWALQIATRNVTLAPPGRLSQYLPEPAPGQVYRSASAAEGTLAWVEGPLARRLPETSGVWEIDVNGSGLWAVLSVAATEARDGAAD